MVRHPFLTLRPSAANAAWHQRLLSFLARRPDGADGQQASIGGASCRNVGLPPAALGRACDHAHNQHRSRRQGSHAFAPPPALLEVWAASAACAAAKWRPGGPLPPLPTMRLLSTQGGKSDRDRPTSAGEEPAASAKEAASGGGAGASGSAPNKKRKGKR